MVGLLIEEAQVATEAMDLASALRSEQGCGDRATRGDEGSALFAESWLGWST